MNYERFLKENLIKKVHPDFKQIFVQTARAKKDIKTAEQVISIDRTWAYTICYHSMIRATRALMYSFGYLPTNKNTHKTLLEFADMHIGSKYSELIRKFNRMRRERHDFIYESKNGISEEQVNSSIKNAGIMLAEAEKIINKNNPQKDLNL